MKRSVKTIDTINELEKTVVNASFGEVIYMTSRMKDDYQQTLRNIPNFKSTAYSVCRFNRVKQINDIASKKRISFGTVET